MTWQGCIATEADPKQQEILLEYVLDYNAMYLEMPQLQRNTLTLMDDRLTQWTQATGIH